MSKQKGRASDQQPDGESPRDSAEEETSTLKVSKQDGQLVGKIAAHRGKSVAKLFKDQDVQDFFTHLLLEEMRLEAERLKKKKQ